MTAEKLMKKRKKVLKGKNDMLRVNIENNLIP